MLAWPLSSSSFPAARARLDAVFVGITEDEAGQLLRQRIAVASLVTDAEQLVSGSRRTVEVTAADVDLPARGLVASLSLAVLSSSFILSGRNSSTAKACWCWPSWPPGRHAVRVATNRWRRRPAIRWRAGSSRRRPGRAARWPSTGPCRRGGAGWPGSAVAARAAVGIAGHHRDLEALARAVEVATAVGEKAHRHVGHAGDVEFGEIERRFLERDQRHLLALLAISTRAPAGRSAKLTRPSASLSARPASCPDVDPAHFDAGTRLAVGQRTDVGICATGVLAQVQAEIADVEVGRLVVAAETVRLRHHRHVDPGLAERRDALDRDEGDAAAFGLLFGEKAADEGAARQLVQLIEIPVADGALEARAAVVIDAAASSSSPCSSSPACSLLVVPGRATTFSRKRQLIGLDLEELDVHFGHIDRGHRQAAVLRRRQNHAAAGEVEGRRQRLRSNREARFLVELAAVTGLSGRAARAARSVPAA
jgi:hypothetical protein